MPLQRVRRVVRRAQDADVHFFKERNRVVGLQLFRRFLPNGGSGLRRQRRVDFEIALQFQMRPVMQRAPGELRHNLRPLLEFLIFRRAAGDVPLVHTADAHRTPFVVICRQPELRQIFVLLPLGNLARRQMVVIVVNRLVLCVLAKERFGHFIFQQKVFVHKCSHRQPSNFSRLIHSPSAGFGM